MAGRLARLAQVAERTGRTRGLVGRSSGWLGVWAVAAGYRHLRNFLAEDPVVVRETLAPGESLVITNYRKGEEPPAPPELSRRQRKAAARRASRATDIIEATEDA